MREEDYVDFVEEALACSVEGPICATIDEVLLDMWFHRHRLWDCAYTTVHQCRHQGRTKSPPPVWAGGKRPTVEQGRPLAVPSKGFRDLPQPCNELRGDRCGWKWVEPGHCVR